jgi:hypothetical protein
MTRVSRVFEPEPGAQAAYDGLYRGLYKRMYGRLRPLSMRSAT